MLYCCAGKGKALRVVCGVVKPNYQVIAVATSQSPHDPPIPLVTSVPCCQQPVEPLAPTCLSHWQHQGNPVAAAATRLTTTRVNPKNSPEYHHRSSFGVAESNNTILPYINYTRTGTSCTQGVENTQHHVPTTTISVQRERPQPNSTS